MTLRQASDAETCAIDRPGVSDEKPGWLTSCSTEASLRRHTSRLAAPGGDTAPPGWALAGKDFFAEYGPLICRKTQHVPLSLKPKTWTTVHHDWVTSHLLGQGTYGYVYKGERRSPSSESQQLPSDSLAALKRCRLDGVVDYGIPETALREVALLAELKDDKNVVGIHNCSCNTERLYIVFEYLDQDLKAHVKELKDRRLKVSAVKKITRSILQALVTMHTRRIIHRDLKPHNILVNRDLSKVKVADLGLARHVCAPTKPLTHEVITLWYRPPELLLGLSKYSYEIDIWSVGCIVAEILKGSPLFPGDSEIDTLFKIFRMFGTPSLSSWPFGNVPGSAVFPKFPKIADPFESICGSVDDEAKSFLDLMLRLNPGERRSARECLMHPWLSSSSEVPAAVQLRPENPSPSDGSILPFSLATGDVVRRALGSAAVSAADQSERKGRIPETNLPSKGPNSRSQLDNNHGWTIGGNSTTTKKRASSENLRRPPI